MFRPCAIVPSRNHFAVVGDIVGGLRAAGLPVFLIDDASDDAARGVLAALHAPERGVTVHRFEANQGKGGAVIKGFELASDRGFTHAVQVDADGQHDLSALPLLLSLGKANPTALIVGAPEFDRSMPRARRFGRWITHLWVCIETLSLQIVDSMCGFRLYPLAPTAALLAEERLGRGMDFDTEILVRLMWRGTPMCFVPVRVSYPAGNLSNFDLWRDNLRISAMHARLFGTMLLRWRQILRNRRRLHEARGSHWSAMAERGTYWGLRCLGRIYRIGGRRLLMLPLLAVGLYFYVSGSEQRRASLSFLRRVAAFQGSKRRPGRLDSLRHSLGFARRTADTFAAWQDGLAPDEIELANPEELLRLTSSASGILLIVSHYGNVELSRALLSPEQRARLTVLVHTAHSANFARLLQRAQPEAAINTLQVTELSPATAMALKEVVDRGGWVAIAGDRTPAGGHGRASRARFLGEDAPFPQGPYIIAHLLECPVYLMFCVREGRRHRLYLEPFAERLALPHRDRAAALDGWAQRYAERLEEYCLRDPYQWYNFFDFWAFRPQEIAAGAG